MLYRFKNFTNETFLPRNMKERDPKMDIIIKQKETTGEVYIDFRDRNVTLIKNADNGKIYTIGSITKRNPWSASIQFKKDLKNNKSESYHLGEFVFYLVPIYADAKKKNLYDPYKLDNMEILGRGFKDYKILYDQNVDKLVENQCKLIYYNEENGVEKAKDLKKEVIKMAFDKNIFCHSIKESANIESTMTDDENYIVNNFDWTPYNVEILTCDAEIDENIGFMTVELTNGDHIEYTCKEVISRTSGLTYKYMLVINGIDVGLDEIEILVEEYFGSTGSLVADILLYYKKRILSKK